MRSDGQRAPKIISFDGPLGVGKTTVSSMLVSYFKNSAVVELSPNSEAREKAAFESVGVTVNFLHEGRKKLNTLFTSDKYDAECHQDCAFLLTSSRLALIQANYALRECEYVFVDTFWDPIWWFTADTIPGYVARLREYVTFPYLSFFLVEEAARLYETRWARSSTGVAPVVPPGFHEDCDSKMNFFTSWASENLRGFRCVSRQGVADTMRHVIEAIKAEDS